MELSLVLHHRRGMVRNGLIVLYCNEVRSSTIRKGINIEALWKDFILTDRVHNAIAEYPRTAASSSQRQKSIGQLPLTDFLDLTR